MSILLAGYGNIGKALVSIMKEQNTFKDIVVCDTKDGVDCRDYIRAHHNELEAVLNLTDLQTNEVLDLCVAYDIDYVDAGIEDFPAGKTAYEYYEELLKTKTQARALFGFGMNPGLVEYIYFAHRPKKEHVAFVFEFDDARRGKEIFNTWSASSYYDEAVHDDKFLAVQGKGGFVVEDPGAFCLTAGGTKREFLLIPHEEVFSLCRKSKTCLASAFLYQAPPAIQNYLLQNGKNITEAQSRELPSLYDVEGNETVGMLFYVPDEENVRYVYNCISHEEIYAKYATNGTCWQTALGVYLALHLRKHLPKHCVATVSDVASEYQSIIGEFLQEVHFEMESVDFYVPREEIERKVLPIFGPLPR